MSPKNDESLFGSFKICEFCGRRLPRDYSEAFCPTCLDYKLLNDVKDFIRENDVNEYQVAERFQIPLKQVKEWIREGRIEYRKNNPTGTIAGMHCQRCGSPVTFGSLCPKCLKLLNTNTKGYESAKLNTGTDNKMRFLDQENHKG